MDPQSSLSFFARPATEPPVSADQAIFTSTPSSFAEGYRIVAASLGLRADEKAEITRWSPSHGNLCAGEGTPEAICSHPMSSGRHCIAHSQPAGLEHSARGSELIYTHLVVMSNDNYARFGCNPLMVRNAVMQQIGGEPMLKTPTVLNPLTLQIEGDYAVSRAIFAHIEVDRICSVASAIMSGQRVVVAGACSPLAALEWALMVLPLSIRQKLAISAGLKYSNVRPTDLAWVDRDQGETERSLRGQKVEFMDAASLIGEQALPPCEWLGLVRRWWRERRWDELCGLTFELSMSVTGADLDRIARMCHALDLLRSANPTTVKELTDPYIQQAPQNDVEAKLIRKLQHAAGQRTAMHV